MDARLDHLLLDVPDEALRQSQPRKRNKSKQEMDDICAMIENPAEEHRPVEIDRKIAELDFAESISESQLLFAELEGSTNNMDSLNDDLQQLYMCCNKNDYKLTWEESGQWTNSQLSTSGFGIAPAAAPNQLTTWGKMMRDRQEKTEPCTSSSSGNNNNNSGVGGEPMNQISGLLQDEENPDERRKKTTQQQQQQQRPTSLLANFANRQRQLDLNRNALREEEDGDGDDRDQGRDADNVNTMNRWRGATMALAQSQSSSVDRQQQQLVFPATTTNGATAAMSSSLTSSSSFKKPVRRTFADLYERAAPELRFLALPHQVPALNASTASLSQLMERVKTADAMMSASLTDRIASFEDNTPDSGLGCSGGGPTHVEDWQSLSILLPKHVAEACSFFKSNSQLLTGSNCTEKSGGGAQNAAAADQTPTGFSGIGRRSFTRSRRAMAQRRTTSVMTEPATPIDSEENDFLNARRSLSPRYKLHSKELSLVGLPLYAQKRQLVERVVESVAGAARGQGVGELIDSLEALLADGLRDGITIWTVARSITAQGAATADCHAVLEQLEGDEDLEEEERTTKFLEHILRRGSLDGWLCYVVLKEKALVSLYSSSSFIRRAATDYRSLLWRLVESLEILSVLSERGSDSWWHGRAPSRLASDSRIPKSSSVPARLSTSRAKLLSVNQGRAKLSVSREVEDEDDGKVGVRGDSRRTSPSKSTKSRIPRSVSSGAAVLSSMRWNSAAAADEARARVERFSANAPAGWLALAKGELLRVLSRRANTAHCARVRPRHDAIRTGRVRIEDLAFLAHEI